jgi:hypothetical protein
MPTYMGSVAFLSQSEIYIDSEGPMNIVEISKSRKPCEQVLMYASQVQIIHCIRCWHCRSSPRHTSWQTKAGRLQNTLTMHSNNSRVIIEDLEASVL